MDNKLLNVNGKEKPLLQMALQFAFHQGNYGKSQFCSAWRESKTHGLILYSYGPPESRKSECNKFPTKMSHIDMTEIVWNWLMDDFAQGVEPLSEWCGDMRHDGHNSTGWQVYLEDWGHVDNDWGTICAIKPAYMWHGK